MKKIILVLYMFLQVAFCALGQNLPIYIQPKILSDYVLVIGDDGAGGRLRQILPDGTIRRVKKGEGIRLGREVIVLLHSSLNPSEVIIKPSFNNIDYSNVDKQEKESFLSDETKKNANYQANTKVLQDYIALGEKMEQLYSDLDAIPFLEANLFNQYLGAMGNALNEMGFSNNVNDWVSEIGTLAQNTDEANAANKSHYFYNLIQQLSTYHIVSNIPIEIKNADLFNVEVTIQNQNTTLVYNPVYEYRVKGGLQFDVAPVFVLHGLFDESYIIKDSSYTSTTVGGTDTVISGYKIIEEGNSPDKVGGFGLGTIVHLYIRTGTIFNVALSGGTFAHLGDDTKFRLMVGGSILIGEGNTRFSLSAGFTRGSVDRLGASQSLNTFTPGQLDEVPIRSEMKNSWYFALGYNVTLGKKIKKD